LAGTTHLCDGLGAYGAGQRAPVAVWAAIALGFVGVVAALEPSSDSLTPAAGIAMLGSGAFAGAMLLGRKLRGTPDTLMVGWQIGGGLNASGMLLALDSKAWQPTPPRDLAAMCLLGVVAMLAHILVNRSFHHAKAVVVLPYQYALLIRAILFGALSFTDMPRPAMLPGAGLIVASGLFIARVSRVHGRCAPVVVR